MNRHQVLIVGAGPGGLASAMLLRQSGCDVTIFERLPHVGGRTSAIEGGGFRFDTGPTFFLYPRVLEEIFAACGRNLRQEVRLIQLDPQYRLVFEEGGDLLATPDVEKMKARIARLCPADAENFPRFLDENRKKLARFKPILESAFSKLTDLLRPFVLKSLPLLRATRSVDGDLRRYFSDPRVRLAFSFQSKYLGMSPFKCPSLFTILSFLEYEYGVWHPVGGCNSVTEAMARVCREMGVEIRMDEPVKQVRFSGRRAIGIETAAGIFDADAVIVNADFAHAMPRLTPNELRKKWNDKKIDRAKLSCSTFMMYLGIEGKCEELEHHTIWLAGDYRTNLREIEQEHVPCGNPSFYVANPCRTDPGMAPAGCSALYCLAPVTHNRGKIDWQAELPRFRNLMFSQLAKLGLKDLERRIRFEKIITPRDWETDYAIHRGATFSLSHNLGQLLHNRPNNRFEDFQNVYLVGGGTHPGSGLPVIFESARISSKLLLADVGMPVSWTRPVSEAARPAFVREAEDFPIQVGA
jgi:phytoene desaturase